MAKRSQACSLLMMRLTAWLSLTVAQ